MHERGIDPVLRKVEIEYLTAVGLDTMDSCLSDDARARNLYSVRIYSGNPGGEPVVRARVEVVSGAGRLTRGDVRRGF